MYGITFLTILVLYFFENNTGTRMILAAVIVLPAVSIVLARLASGHVQAALDLPERRKKTEKLLGFVVLDPWPGIRMAGNVTIVHAFSGMHAMHVLCTGGGMGAFELQEHCGAVEVSLDSVECGDLFGLFCFRRPVRIKRICLIEPPLFPLNSDLLEMDELLAEDGENISQRKCPDSFEPDGVREYRPGDRIQAIHWKLSSKTDQLLVRESDTLNGQIPLLVLDSRCAEEVRDNLMSALLSFSSGLFYRQIPHALSVRGMPAAESESFAEAMDRLLLGELLREEPPMPPEYASVFLFTDEPEYVPDPDWAGHRIHRVFVRPENAGEHDLVLNLERDG